MHTGDTGKNGAEGAFSQPEVVVYSWFIFARNSALLRTFSSRVINSSIASTGDSGLSTRRRMRCAAGLLWG